MLRVNDRKLPGPAALNHSILRIQVPQNGKIIGGIVTGHKFGNDIFMATVSFTIPITCKEFANDVQEPIAKNRASPDVRFETMTAGAGSGSCKNTGIVFADDTVQADDLPSTGTLHMSR